MKDIFFILLAVGFVLLNAFFVAAEFAMVKLRYSRVQDIKKNKNYGLRGRVLIIVHQHLDTYLSACQLGITLASLGLGWVGEPAFAKLFIPVFLKLNIHSADLIKIISFGAAFSLISFLHIVVGELMPKSMAIRQSEKISLWTAVPLYGFYWLMYPFIWILNLSANSLLKLFGLNTVQPGELPYSTEEIKFILNTSRNPHQRQMLINMLEFSTVQAVDLMRPIEEMISIPESASREEKFDLIKKYQYTRYPVYKIDPDNNIKNNYIKNIIGILHIKDFTLGNTGLRPVFKAQHHTSALKILDRFRKGTTHFALVYHDEKLIGFITLDNLLSGLMGKMQDEFHPAQEDFQLMPDGSYLLKGSTPVYVIQKITETDLSAYPAHTAAGLLLEELRRIPAEGDTWTHANFTLRVLRTKGPRILKIGLIIKKII